MLLLKERASGFLGRETEVVDASALRMVWRGSKSWAAVGWYWSRDCCWLESAEGAVRLVKIAVLGEGTVEGSAGDIITGVMEGPVAPEPPNDGIAVYGVFESTSYRDALLTLTDRL